MDEYDLKMLLALVMFITTAIAGFAPFKIIKMIAARNNRTGDSSRRAAWVLSLMSCYGGGVFLATCFLDILPHVNGTFDRFNSISSLNTSYPLCEFIVCVGFFLVYILEEVSEKLFVKRKHSPKTEECEKLNDIEEDERSVIKHKCDGSNINDTIMEKNDTNENNECPEKGKNLVENDNELSDMLHSITFTCSMSFHSILEGVALGVQDTKIGIATLFVSLIIHKGLEAYSVGTQISRSNSKRTRIVIIAVLIYSSMTPIGSITGQLLQSANFNESYKEGILFVLEALAVGTFIYVTFFEVLALERSNEFSNLIQLLAIILGFLTIAFVQYVELLLHSHF